MNDIDKLLKEAKLVAYSEAKKYSSPILKHIDLATEKGIQLAKQLDADIKIVEIGTLLMDVKIGEAISLNKLEEHVDMSYKYTKELLSKYPNISEEVKKNIEACVLQYHGKDNFYSIESETCCNADCYRFCSIKGVSYLMRYFRDIDFEDLVILMKKKLEEKWNALSLDICRKELEPEYKIIKEFLKYLL
jgi:hypothetical protein